MFKMKCISHAVSSCRAEVCVLGARVTLLWGAVGRVFRPVVNYRLYSPRDRELHTAQPTYPSVSLSQREGGRWWAWTRRGVGWALGVGWMGGRETTGMSVCVCVFLGTAAGVDAEISKLIRFLSHCSGPGGKRCDVYWQHTRQNHTPSISLPPCSSTKWAERWYHVKMLSPITIRDGRWRVSW